MATIKIPESAAAEEIARCRHSNYNFRQGTGEAGYYYKGCGVVEEGDACGTGDGPERQIYYV